MPEWMRPDVETFRAIQNDPFYERLSDTQRVCFFLHRLQQTIERAAPRAQPRYETKG